MKEHDAQTGLGLVMSVLGFYVLGGATPTISPIIGGFALLFSGFLLGVSSK